MVAELALLEEMDLHKVLMEVEVLVVLDMLLVLDLLDLYSLQCLLIGRMR